jgi:hypothetical protein
VRATDAEVACEPLVLGGRATSDAAVWLDRIAPGWPSVQDDDIAWSSLDRHIQVTGDVVAIHLVRNNL